MQHYPTLERLQFRLSNNSTSPATQIAEVKPFLEKHSNLKHFEIDFDFLWANRSLLNQTNIQLDLLNIHFYKRFINSRPNKLIEFLRALHVRGFYKTLQFSSCFIINDRLSNEISTFSTFDQLSISENNLYIDLNRFSNLRELFIHECSYSANMETVAKNLSKLEQLTVIITRPIDSILPFVCHSKRLKTIRIGRLRDPETLDLFALNQERKTLMTFI